MRKYRCIVVDPPWDQGMIGRTRQRQARASELPYETMGYQEIMQLPIAEWAEDDCFLWLWVTLSKDRQTGLPVMRVGFSALETWGFEYYTMITWNKSTGVCPFGPYRITTEHCLFAYRGKFEPPVESLGKMQTCFHAPVVRHSEKPSVFYQNIAKYFPGPRLDAFARRAHPGFHGWGNEYEEAPSEAAQGVLL